MPKQVCYADTVLRDCIKLLVDSTHKTTTPLVEGWTPDSPSGSTAAGSVSIPKKRSAPKGGAAPRTAKKRAPK